MAYSFKLKDDLRLLAESRVHLLEGEARRISSSVVVDEDQLTPNNYYGGNFDESRKICQRLAKDPYKISSQDIDNIIALPDFARLVDFLINLDSSNNALSAAQDFLEQVAELSYLITQTLIPITEDYIRLGRSKPDLEKKEYFRELMNNGIALNERTHFKIIKELKSLLFEINQGNNSSLQMEVENDNLKFVFKKSANEALILLTDLQNQRFDVFVKGKGINSSNSIFKIPFDELTTEAILSLKNILQKPPKSF